MMYVYFVVASLLAKRAFQTTLLGDKTEPSAVLIDPRIFRPSSQMSPSTLDSALISSLLEESSEVAMISASGLPHPEAKICLTI